MIPVRRGESVKRETRWCARCGEPYRAKAHETDSLCSDCASGEGDDGELDFG